MRLLDWKFTVLSHNTIRGAAGAALLNAELLVSLGKLGAGKLDNRKTRSGCGTCMSKLVVMKFGGTSVEDAPAIYRTAGSFAAGSAKGFTAHGRCQCDG